MKPAVAVDEMFPEGPGPFMDVDEVSAKPKDDNISEKYIWL